MKRLTVRRSSVIAGLALGLVALVLVLGLPARGRKLTEPLVLRYGVDDPRFARSLSALAGPPLVNGNRVTALHNGVQTFPAMLAAIAAATQSVTFESAYFRQDTMTRAFADALIGRARAGVPVHMIVDWFGLDDGGRAQLDRLREHGVQVEVYHRPRPWRPRRSANRTHRRILVVDGRVGFTGGVCVADTWMGDADHKDHWRDIHFRVEGPAVSQLQAAFMDNWRDNRGTVLHGDRYFPPPDSAGPMRVQVSWSAPDEGSENLRLTYLLALAAARERVLIQNPYFVPDDVVRQALIDARRRGVAVTVMLPHDSVTDARVTQKSSRSRWGPLLEAGVELRLYQPTLLHQKVMIVDGLFVTAGSANFDYRSFRLNDEVNINVLDRALAAGLAAAFRDDLGRSEPYTLEHWNQRGALTRLAERAAGLIRFQF